MAIPYNTGPVIIGVQTAGRSAPVFLGTAEQAPDYEIRPQFEPIHNDLSGTKVAFDHIYELQDVFVSMVLTRWNEPIVAEIQALPTTLGTRGRNVAGDVGTIMGLEGAAFQTFLWFMYSG